MKKLSITLAGLALAAWGCASMEPGLNSANPTGIASQPVITEAYASKEMRLGDTWKVYINASDADGMMKYIVVNVTQLGNTGAYPISFIRIKKENSRDLSGYIYLNTNQNALQGGLNFTNITLTAEIKNKNGYTSKPLTFPLHFTNVRQAPPPPGVFQEKDLGPIMISIEAPNKFD